MAISASVGPVTSVALGGRSNLSARAGPEPAVNIRRLQVSAVTTSKVAFATRRPNVADVSTRDSLLDEFVFLKIQKLFNLLTAKLK